MYLRWLATDRLRRRERLPEKSVVLVVATTANVRRVVQLSAHAHRKGVRAGMTLAHAGAILPGGAVHVRDHDERRDAQTLAALARWSERFSPVVSVDGVDGLLLDISGCEHLFGGEMALATAARDGLAMLGFSSRIGIASCVGAAWAVARFARGGGVVRVEEGEERRALASLPVAALRVDPAIEEGLREVAIERIGQVFDLPRSALPARYGDELLHRIDQALGARPEPVGRLSEHVVFAASRELPGGTTQIEVIERVVRQLLTELRELLERHESGVRRLEVAFDRLDAATSQMHLAVVRPTRSDTHLWALVRPRIERLDMGYGVERVTLTASHVARLPHHQGGLRHDEREATGSAADDASFAEMLDSLVGRFGHDRVLRIELRQSHKPERAAALVPILEPAATRSDEARRFTFADRPSRLFETPRHIRVLAVTPDGPVIRLWRDGVERGVLGSVGPERIGGEWWIARESARDYYRVQEDSGRWLWLYQDRASREWFIHGEWE